MHSARKDSLFFCLFGLLLGLAACDDDRGGKPIWPDAAGLDAVAAGSFLAPCTTSSDCIFGLCIDIAGEQRCSKPCGDPSACPALSGWSCEASACHCAATMGESTCATDHDCDGFADVTPAAEVCNGLDDDCNGVVDDVAPGAVGATRYFPDHDHDGYGDSSLGVWACAKPEGYVEQGGDCDDEVTAVNPGQEEICGDAYDNDCDFELDDPDVCGQPPLSVDDVTGPDAASLHLCGEDVDVSPAFDLIEIVAAQDSQRLRFTLRLEGAPATQSCSTYRLGFGDAAAIDAVTYLYRPGFSQCVEALPRIEAYDAQGVALSTTAEAQFNANAPGSVSFIIPRAEIYSRVPDPSYWIEACTIEQAGSGTDLAPCAGDRCAGPVHR